MNNGFTKLYHNIWEDIKDLNKIEKLLYIYLLDKQNYYGNKEFFITDKEICKDLGICRKTLYLCRERVKNTHSIRYERGKYTKCASKYHIECVKSSQRVCKDYSTIRNNKEELNKEKDLKIPKDWLRETLSIINR